MTLSPGTRLGSLEIVATIGAGAMGEVYRAHDNDLGRDVAVKILPAAMAGDDERIARFEREAKLLASLNHPNIAQIYGVTDSPAGRALVMELVDGQTLADTRLPLPLDEAVTVARQIAGALEAAHEQGVVHRDLKPANIKRRPDDVVKVLDFGLAKALAPADSAEVDAPTMSMAGTALGTILGTAQYMAPEQARGKTVDQRADIWSFGCVLYELLTGKRAFAGATMTDVLAAVVHKEPEWSALPPSTPVAIRRLLKRCLEKDPKRRLQAIGDARLELEDLAASGSREVGTADGARVTSRGRLYALAALVFMVGAIVGAVAWRTIAMRQPELSLRRLTLTLPATDTLSGAGPGSVVAVAPDGRTLVYVATRGGVTQLFRRSFDASDPAPIAGTEGAYDPFFSPDGAWVAFAAAGKLKKTSLAGRGEPVTLCAVGSITGGTWGPDDTIVFAAGDATGLRAVPAAGGTPRSLTSRKPGDFDFHALPEFLPGGRAVLFSVNRGNSDVPGIHADLIAAYSFDDGRVHEITNGHVARYSPTGHLLVMRGASLYAIPFDAAHLRVTGEAIELPERVRAGVSAGGHFGFGADGLLVYVPAGTPPKNRPVWVDAQGASTPLGLDARHYQDIALSPDGLRVALTTDFTSERGDTRGVMWVQDIARRTGFPLSGTPDSATEAPVWSHDGRLVTFARWQVDRINLIVRPADATRPEERLTDKAAERIPQFLTPDGKTLVFSQILFDQLNFDLMTLSLDGTHREQTLLATPANEMNAALSLDGRYMAYQSDESGRFEVEVRPFPDAGRTRWVISNEGGVDPRWSPSGRELYYRSGRRIMVVPIETTPEFKAGQTRVFFEGRLTQRADVREGWLWRDHSYDVSRDGKRLLVLEDESGAEDDGGRIAIVENWPAELRKK